MSVTLSGDPTQSQAASRWDRHTSWRVVIAVSIGLLHVGPGERSDPTAEKPCSPNRLPSIPAAKGGLRTACPSESVLRPEEELSAVTGRWYPPVGLSPAEGPVLPRSSRANPAFLQSPRPQAGKYFAPVRP